MAEHGLQSVNMTVREILHEDYQYLRSIFKGSEQLAVSVVEPSVPVDGIGSSAPAPTPALPSTENVSAAATDSSVKKMRVRVLKAKVEEAVSTQPAAVPLVVEEQPHAMSTLNVMIPHSSSFGSESTVSSPLSQPAQRSSQDIKKFQKLQEETKRRELKEKGISLDQVLTKENLQKWIVEEKHTFAWVAREKAGCPETQVSSIAKAMGFQSPISARRGMMVSKKGV